MKIHRVELCSVKLGQLRHSGRLIYASMPYSNLLPLHLNCIGQDFANTYKLTWDQIKSWSDEIVFNYNAHIFIELC